MAQPVHVLLPTQRNFVLEQIVARDLDPNDFEWMTPVTTTERSNYGDAVFLRQTLLHKPTKFFCSFGWPNQELTMHLSPGAKAPVETQFAGTWSYGMANVADWVARLSQEYAAPDLWEIARDARDLFTFTGQLGRTEKPLSGAEVASLKQALAELREQTSKQFSVTSEQLTQLKVACDEIIESSRRVSPKDLKLLVAGHFLGWLFQMPFSRDDAIRWLLAAGAAVAGFFRHLLP